MLGHNILPLVRTSGLAQAVRQGGDCLRESYNLMMSSLIFSRRWRRLRHEGQLGELIALS